MTENKQPIFPVTGTVSGMTGDEICMYVCMYSHPQHLLLGTDNRLAAATYILDLYTHTPPAYVGGVGGDE
jgi:hypothetical protein